MRIVDGPRTKPANRENIPVKKNLALITADCVYATILTGNTLPAIAADAFAQALKNSVELIALKWQSTPTEAQSKR